MAMALPQLKKVLVLRIPMVKPVTETLTQEQIDNLEKDKNVIGYRVLQGW